MKNMRKYEEHENTVCVIVDYLFLFLLSYFVFLSVNLIEVFVYISRYFLNLFTIGSILPSSFFSIDFIYLVYNKVFLKTKIHYIVQPLSDILLCRILLGYHRGKKKLTFDIALFSWSFQKIMKI